MQSDRELLELAAKAAGLKLYEHRGCFYLHCVDDRDASPTWNPLTHNEDAFDLALAIPACVVIDNDMQWCGVHLNDSRGKYDVLENFGDDKAAATRRAITRAAAQLAQAQEGK